MNGDAVSWKSSKQSTVADSATEAEYIAASDAAKEAVWIRKFTTKLGVVLTISDPIVLFCDNNDVIAIKKSLGHIKGPSTYSGVFISLEKSMKEVI